MAFVKFIIAALAAAVFTTSVLGNPVPTADISVNHLEKRVCNEYGCGMKCKGTANTPCSKKLNSFHDCDICSYFLYAADGSAKRLWDAQCLEIQWGNLAPLAQC